MVEIYRTGRFKNRRQPKEMPHRFGGESPFASKCAPALRYEIDFSAKVAELKGCPIFCFK
jgi:hypothetical protein